MARAFISVNDVVAYPAQSIRMSSAPLRIQKGGEVLDLAPHQTYRLIKQAAGKLPINLAYEVDAVLAGTEQTFSAGTRSAMLAAMGQVINTNGLDEIVRPASFSRAIC